MFFVPARTSECHSIHTLIFLFQVDSKNFARLIPSHLIGYRWSYEFCEQIMSENMAEQQRLGVELQMRDMTAMNMTATSERLQW
jgi:hypothetical protein